MRIVTIENFQSVREKQEVPVGGLTLLYGNNSSGKSIIKDVLEVGSGMSKGPVYNRPKAAWVNNIALKKSEPVKLGYGFFMLEAYMYGKENFIKSLIFDSLQGAEVSEFIKINSKDESVKFLSDYLFHSIIYVEYTWSDESSLIDGRKCNAKVAILLDRFGSENDPEPELIAEIYYGDKDITVSFQENHELIKSLSDALSDSNFIDGEDLSSFVLTEPFYSDLNPVIDRYRCTQELDSETDESDIGFVFVFFCVTAVHHLVSLASRIKYVDDIREKSEHTNDDKYYGAEYWKRLKSLVFQEYLGHPSFMGDLERINKWLAGKQYLDTGYELAADFNFLISMETLQSIKDVGVKDFLVDIGNNESLEYSRLMLKDVHTSQLIDFSDVGTGVSQLMPILYYMSQSGLFGDSVYIQQPELHLHPRLQAGMAQIFIDSFITNDKTKSYIVETHSELIILRLLKVIRESYSKENLLEERALLAEDVNVIFAVKDDGVTTYKKLRISKNGDFLDKWPEGFFEERDQELF